MDVVGKITALESLNSEYLNTQGVSTVDHSTARAGTGPKKGCRVRAIHKYSGGQEQWSNKGERSGQKTQRVGLGRTKPEGRFVGSGEKVRPDGSGRVRVEGPGRVGADKNAWGLSL